ncbi:SCO family protein [Zobellia galactanivorans]|uniref:SCO family protein n=1 Tax=Zobellia galactanivorans (strain DSM 12802 / CCUG 47099 / CIP 106680 / NCIMB 13871 / Dsij) TaxID=63186 RepID=UPI001C067EC3|nr:SCO family protein [Zobellia galactanivorans]MBU3026040.1 SCO family protein [Zobellia galactanivorans]
MNYSRNLLFVLVVLGFVSCADTHKNKAKTALVENTEVSQLPYFNSALFTPEWNKGTHKIPDFSFTNQNGENVTNASLEGKIYVADFFFTICPGICPKLTKNMGLLQEVYKDDPDIRFLSHSVMPTNDTVEKLAQYAREHDVHLPQWHLLTGDKDAIYDIARNGYFADDDFTKTQDIEGFIHTENFILVDGKGYIRGVYNGTLALEMKRLKRHIEILKKEP